MLLFSCGIYRVELLSHYGKEREISFGLGKIYSERGCQLILGLSFDFCLDSVFCFDYESIILFGSEHFFVWLLSRL